jgi:solute carrier family 13 (sodium-dependent dicarboxylate transporter), member 2/3/5
VSEHAEVIETLSAAEKRFEQLRRRSGLFIAPALFLIVLFLPLEGLRPEAHRLAAVMAGVIALWMTEALPLPISAMLGAAACVVMRVAPAKDVFAPFADPLMFLFIGSFILARGIFVHRLDRRIAFGVLSLPWVGARPSRILFAFGATTCFLSVFISNTATTAMMFAIGLSILRFFFDHEEATNQRINRKYATALMLMASFASSIALALPIGTPPNIIGIAFLRQIGGVEISFFEWSLVGIPVTIVMFLFLYFYLNTLCPAGVNEIAGSRELVRAEKQELGTWTAGQRSVMIAFAVTILLWIVPGIVAIVAGERSLAYQNLNNSLPEAVAAIIGAGLLFLLPGNETSESGGARARALTWDDAVRIDWGVVLLYGGGFALGVLSFQTGLAESVGRSLTNTLPAMNSFGLLVASTVIAVVVSEATSNTASANMVIPVVIAISQAAGVDPLEPALGATMGTSLGFMLPVSTPCNAIVYGSGYVPIGRMIRYGFLLDVAGIIVIVTLVRLLAPFIR